MQVKPGYKTTEFWLAVIVVLGTTLDSLAGSLPNKYAALVAAVAAGPYPGGRGHAQPPAASPRPLGCPTSPAAGLRLAAVLSIALVLAPVGFANPPKWWVRDAMCVHKHEGAWNATSNPGYYGGFQMDSTFA